MKKIRFIIAVLIVLYTAVASLASDIALSSAGQGADAMMVRVILKSAGFEPDFDAQMKADKLLSSHKVLVLVVGGSSKGLGAAGIKQSDEIERIKSLINAAENKKMKIFVMHVGGENRRGAMTDAYITETAQKGDALLVVSGGNNDGIFTKNAKAGVEVKIAPSMNEIKEPLKAILASWNVAK